MPKLGDVCAGPIKFGQAPADLVQSRAHVGNTGRVWPGIGRNHADFGSCIERSTQFRLDFDRFPLLCDVKCEASMRFRVSFRFRLWSVRPADCVRRPAKQKERHLRAATHCPQFPGYSAFAHVFELRPDIVVTSDRGCSLLVAFSHVVPEPHPALCCASRPSSSAWVPSPISPTTWRPCWRCAAPGHRSMWKSGLEGRSARLRSSHLAASRARAAPKPGALRNASLPAATSWDTPPQAHQSSRPGRAHARAADAAS